MEPKRQNALMDSIAAPPLAETAAVPPPTESADGDPWGVRRAEVLITSLRGVLSARVVQDRGGVVREVHVLTDTGLTPKQVVRNVESAVLAQLGVRLDHRKISVAQTTEVLPIEVMEERVVAEKARKRTVVFRQVEVTPTETPHRVTVTVTLERAGQKLVAAGECGDAPKMRVLAAARAAVSIVNDLIPDGTVDLAGAHLLDAFDSKVVLVGIHVLDGRETRLQVGSCVIRGSGEQAAVLSVLNARNRQIANM